MVELPASENRTAMPCYQIGPENPKRLLLVFSDVYGIDSGLHKVICDHLQEKLGEDTAVWMPDLFRGKAIVGAWSRCCPDWLITAMILPSVLWACSTNMKEHKVDADLREIVAPAVSSKTENVATLGFCYGGWVVGKTLAMQDFPAKAGVGVHPAWAVQEVFGKKDTDLATAVGKAPILLLPASNDEPAKVGTKVVEILAKARGVEESVVSVEFPEMIHGFVPRGDSSDAKVKEAQDQATTMACDFIKEHVKV